MARTSLFIRPLLEFLFPGAGEATHALYHFYIRKFAHLSEYALLAAAAARAFRTSSRIRLKSHWALWALVAVLTISAIDEAFQSFNPARTGSIYDVAIDLTGGILGLAAISLIAALWHRKGPNHKRMPESKTDS